MLGSAVISTEESSTTMKYAVEVRATTQPSRDFVIAPAARLARAVAAAMSVIICSFDRQDLDAGV
jgi:hypothetical protein